MLFYENLNWTFHAKGIWLVHDAANATELGGTATAPTSTYIGSSNMGHRSWTRDFELGFVLTTHKQKFKDILAKEWEHLSSYTRDHKATNSVTSLLESANRATSVPLVRGTAPALSLVQRPGPWKISLAKYLARYLKTFL